ncbi:MAG: YceI family protein [Deltaproteobacteria bacterium]|nr:YceI family protein [Deltaproteobacteria bacterium]
MKKLLLTLSILALSSAAFAAESFTVDPKHTFPGFEVNHMGLSTQRGRFNASSGKITLDRAGKTGTVDIEIDAGTVNTGLPALEKHLRSEDFFNVEKYPKITFKSNRMDFEEGAPKSIHGELTLLGITKPVTLQVSSFNCRVHPINKIYAVPAVSDDVRLFIQIEAFRD